MVRAALAQVPELDPARVEDLLLGCGMPGGEQGMNMARIVAVLLGLDGVPGTTVNRYCSSSPADHPHGVPRDQGRRGRRVRLGRRRVASAGTAIGNSDYIPGVDAREPAVRATPSARTRRARPDVRRAWVDPRDERPAARRRTSRWARPPRTSPQLTRHHARASRTSSRRCSQNRAETAIADGFWARRDHAGDPRRRHGRVGRRRPARRRHASSRSRASNPVFRPDGTVTAGNCCPLNDGAAAVVVVSDRIVDELGPHPARPHRLDRGQRAVAGDHGPRAGRRVAAWRSPAPV